MRYSLAFGLLHFLADLAAAQDFNGTVTHVHDGDTAHIKKADGSVVKVRFILSDAPEIDQPRGVESRDFVRTLCLGQDVLVKTKGTDDFGRTLGELMIGSTSVNKQTIAQGHAWWFYNFDNPDPVEQELGALEAAAKAAKKGLWQDEAPIYPRAWRRGARLGGSIGGGGGGEEGGEAGGAVPGPDSTVFIMALLPNPRGEDANNETAILANGGDVEASIDEWKLEDDDGGVFTLSGTVPAGGSRTIRLSSSLPLGNSGDRVELRKPDGAVAHSLQYSGTHAGRFVLAK